jgi:putative nucleotidyltransferase with HDIG domain
MSPDASRNPITDEMKESVRRDLPEIDDITDKALADKVVDAWALALSETRYKAISEVPPWGNPKVFVIKRGSQAQHLRGVAHLAVAFAKEFSSSYPEVSIDHDIVLAGALCHDIGKPYEFDNQERWSADPSVYGYPSMRHPAYGAHLCLVAGLPEQIVHIAMAHSPVEGDSIVRSLECTIVRYADNTWWRIAGVCGLLKPETMGPMGFPYSIRKTALD